MLLLRVASYPLFGNRRNPVNTSVPLPRAVKIARGSYRIYVSTQQQYSSNSARFYITP